VNVLKARFPHITGPRKDDICYATTNRQEAVKSIAASCERVIVVGSPNSSNSIRLVEVAMKAGCPHAMLVECAEDIAWNEFSGIARLGITAGASAPEALVDEIVGAFRKRFDARIETVTTANETVAFKLPRELRTKPAA